ncbi:MAG: GNAT family N-acetyltransferase [Alphaproteobacteria bacterium]|nr:GNAT family N-acetyltransferase [Alphaproteobacteria bacterium]
MTISPKESLITIRSADANDIEIIHKIYEHYVLTSTATFEIIPPDLKEMQRRWEQMRTNRFPFLVAEKKSTIAGFAYVNFFRARSAYQQTLEDSIYIDPNFMGQGIGFQLLDEVLKECQKLNIKEIIAVIGDSQNQASIHLHHKLNFRHIGILSNVGFKFNKWLDVVLMQKSLR